MDYLRSCYQTTMVFRTGDDPVVVEWYFVEPHALPFPGWSRFGSANWKNRDCTAGDLGEQPGPRNWTDGSFPQGGFIGDRNSQSCAASRASWWVDGIPSGDGYGPFDANGVPLCCINGPGCVSSQYDLLTAEIIDIAGCGNLGTPTSLARIDPGLCKWFGTYPCSLGDCAASVEFIPPDQWILQTTCDSDGATATAPFVSGGSVSFTVDDDGGCCIDGVPPRSFTFKVNIP